MPLLPHIVAPHCCHCCPTAPSISMASFFTTVRTQQLYFIRKVHKTPMSIRPIVSGSGGPTENVSQFLDFFLAPLIKSTPAYLRDSTHLIQLLENFRPPPDAILCTVDVVGLYLHIPHGDGVKAALSYLYGNPAVKPPFPAEVAKALFAIALEHNYFEFNGR